MGEKPTAAFVLSLVGGILILLSGLIFTVILGIFGAAFFMVPVPGAAVIGGQ